jgi:hypothetical protein
MGPRKTHCKGNSTGPLRKDQYPLLVFFEKKNTPGWDTRGPWDARGQRLPAGQGGKKIWPATDMMNPTKIRVKIGGIMSIEHCSRPGTQERYRQHVLGTENSRGGIREAKYKLSP